MPKIQDWSPDRYLRFADERALPAMDLAARIRHEGPRRIMDLGCGPGNSAEILARRWPEAAFTGLDSSPAMIETARKAHPEMRWILADAAAWEPDGMYDLVSSSGTIQWIPDHERLFAHWFGFLAPDGALATQIPRFDLMPASPAIGEAARDGRWRARMEAVPGHFTFHDAAFYYDAFAALGAASFDAWETFYIHVMDGHRAITEMLRATALRPYLAVLETDAEREAFLAAYTEAVARAYPPQADGKVLFPFRRLFFVAYKG
jgi:trans-aconitate 2-methyltransferase